MLVSGFGKTSTGSLHICLAIPCNSFLSNPVGSSSAAGVKPHFSGTGVEVVGLAVLWSLRKQGPAGVDLVSNVNRRWTGVNVWPW